MKYQEFVDELRDNGYENVGKISDIDKGVVEDDPKYNKCDECHSLLRYEGWMKLNPHSYRALAICTNSKCQETFEF